MNKTTHLANGLSLRANKCLELAGVPVEKEAVFHALRTGVLFPFLRPAQYGKTTHQEVCRWAGLPESFLPPIREVPVNIYPDNGLSYRAWRCLCRAGIPITKASVMQALTTGALCPGKRPYSYGKTTHADVCCWVGINSTTLQPLANHS